MTKKIAILTLIICSMAIFTACSAKESKDKSFTPEGEMVQTDSLPPMLEAKEQAADETVESVLEQTQLAEDATDQELENALKELDAAFEAAVPADDGAPAIN